MDPHTTLLALLEAIRDRNTREATGQANDLMGWLYGGGFAPFGINEAIQAAQDARAKADKPEGESREARFERLARKAGWYPSPYGAGWTCEEDGETITVANAATACHQSGISIDQPLSVQDMLRARIEADNVRADIALQPKP